MATTESNVVLDSSALVAILSGEEGAKELLIAADAFTKKLVGAPSVVEATMVLEGRKGLKADDLSDFLTRIDAVVLPFNYRHVEAAAQAFRQFGEGRHPAGLNFGDCLSYAVAKLADAPILAVGGDFGKTDVRVLGIGR